VAKTYYVYILSNAARMLYIGVTNNLVRRMSEHRQRYVPGFASRYNLTRLVYYENTTDIRSAIVREKQIKGWLRSRKTALIRSVNPRWKDLAADWFRDKKTLPAVILSGAAPRRTRSA